VQIVADDLVPTMTSDKVINPDLVRFLGAPPGATLVAQVDGSRRSVKAVFYDDHTNEIVVYVGATSGDER